MADASKDKQPDQLTSIRETLIGITIAFTLAFVFRGFVIEGFVIPTGSMAPTLLGKHIRVADPNTGYAWDVGPWVEQAGVPSVDQGEIRVTDPMSNQEVVRASQRIRWGDRVFVLKYLPLVNQPERWDVTVFRNPATQENYIKRMVGLPNEQLALVDGDVFTRPFTGDKQNAPRGIDAWELGDWQIERKPERVQRELWNPVHDTQYAVRNPTPGEALPWIASERSASWRGLRGEAIDGTIRLEAPSGTLDWNASAWPIDDWNAYNEVAENLAAYARSPYNTPEGARATLALPVSDVALTLVVEPDEGASTVVTPTIRARGYEFRAVVGNGQARIEQRDADANPDTNTEFVLVDEGAGVTFEHGLPQRVEFWHVDQALWLFVGGDLVAGGPESGGYELSPAERLTRATVQSIDELPQMLDGHREFLETLEPFDARTLAADRSRGIAPNAPTVLADPAIYRRVRVSLAIEGGPATLHRLRLDRDLHYNVSVRQATRGTHPDYFPTLGPDQFFMCGDNSSSSLDSRLWQRGGPTFGEPDPWISEYVEDELGIAHRRLLLGRAFVVYFPAPYRVGPIPVPDLGKVRWIW